MSFYIVFDVVDYDKYIRIYFGQFTLVISMAFTKKPTFPRMLPKRYVSTNGPQTLRFKRQIKKNTFHFVVKKRYVSDNFWKTIRFKLSNLKYMVIACWSVTYRFTRIVRNVLFFLFKIETCLSTSINMKCTFL